MQRTIVDVALEDTSHDAVQVMLTFDCGHMWLEWVTDRNIVGLCWECPTCPLEGE